MTYTYHISPCCRLLSEFLRIHINGREASYICKCGKLYNWNELIAIEEELEDK